MPNTTGCSANCSAGRTAPGTENPGLSHLRVGGKPLPEFSQLTHRVPMLSLGNAFSDMQADDFTCATPS
jgi:NAD-dependent DNA ligase